MSSSSDSDFSADSSSNNDEDMKKLLAEYDNDDVYVDSDEEENDNDAKLKAALRKATASAEDSDDSSSEEEDEEEESEEEEEEAHEPEVAEEPEEESDDEKEEEEEEKEDTSDIESLTSDEPIVDEFKKKPKKKKDKKLSKKITDPDEADDEEDAAMKELLANWDAENGAADDDDDDSDDDSADDSERSERDVILEDNVLDHIVLACGDLEVGMADFEKQTGVAPVIAGTIKGLGIKCARVSFTDASYIEIIAPDPKGPGPIGELIKGKRIKELTPFHYAIRTSRAEALKDEVKDKFHYVPDHITMFGAKSDGTPKKWEMLYLYNHKLGGICPFFINWNNCDHPCASLPVVGKLKKISIRAPEDDPVHQLFQHVGIKGFEVEEGSSKFSFSFKSNEGTVKFSTKKATGFKFPGFEADAGEMLEDEDEYNDVDFDAPTMPDLLPVSDEDYEAIPEAAY